jgi:hypothetical protein
MAIVLLPGLLATEAAGRKEFDVEAETVGDALRALPVRDLLLDEAGAVRPLVNVFVDGQPQRDLEAAVGAASKIRIVAAIAGG